MTHEFILENDDQWHLVNAGACRVQILGKDVYAHYGLQPPADDKDAHIESKNIAYPADENVYMKCILGRGPVKLIVTPIGV